MSPHIAHQRYHMRPKQGIHCRSRTGTNRSRNDACSLSCLRSRHQQRQASHSRAPQSQRLRRSHALLPPLETNAARFFSDNKSRDVLKLACRSTPECDLEHKVSLINIGPVMWSANGPEHAAEPGPVGSGRPFSSNRKRRLIDAGRMFVVADLTSQTASGF